MKRHTWQMPWSFREGFIIIAGLATVGTIWQAFFPLFSFEVPAWPGNIILGLVFIGFLLAVHIFFRKSALVKWLSSIPAAVTSTALYCGVAILMGIIPQQPTSSEIIQQLALNQIGQSWVFVLSNVYFLAALGLATLKRLIPFKQKNIGYLLNHAGLWIALTAAALGSSDLQRITMDCYEGKPEWRAFYSDGRMVELPIAVELIDFSIEEYPPKLTLIDNQTGKVVMEHQKNQYFSVNESPIRLLNFNIDVLKYYESAGFIGDRFEQVHDMGASPAAWVSVTDLNGGVSQQGWVGSGSFFMEPHAFKISEAYSLVMLPPEPRKYQSDVRLMSNTGKQTMATLEVNKPLKFEGWTLYQLSYDTKLGKWSALSVVELVRDPWISAVYMGIFMLLAGTIFLFLDGTNRTKLMKDGVD